MMSGNKMTKKAKLGTGARFKTLMSQLKRKKVGKTARGRKMAKALPGKTKKIKNPAALAAWIGRKKFGKKKFQKLAIKSKK